MLIYKFSAKDIDTSILSIANMTITHLQVVYIITSISYNLPKIFIKILTWLQVVFGFVFLDLVTSPECEIHINYYIKWIILSLFPIMIFTFLSVFYFCNISENWNNKVVKMMTMIVCIFYIYSITQSFKIWDCVKLVSNTYVLEDNPDIECFVGGEWEKMAIIGFFMLLVYIFGPPFGLIKIFKSSDINTIKIQKRFGWLYQKYKDEFYLWELQVEMCKKFLLVFWATFLPEQHSQSSLILLTLLVCWYKHYVDRPYKEENDQYPTLENDLQNWLYLYEIILLIGMWIYSNVGGNENTATAIFLIIYFIALFVIVYHVILLKRRQPKKDVQCMEMV